MGKKRKGKKTKRKTRSHRVQGLVNQKSDVMAVPLAEVLLVAGLRSGIADSHIPTKEMLGRRKVVDLRTTCEPIMRVRANRW
jgi:hypothetical protein